MKQLDVIKLTLLLAAVLIWFFGLRANNNPLMLVGIVLVVAAFMLRFVKPPGPTPPAP